MTGVPCARWGLRSAAVVGVTLGGLLSLVPGVSAQGSDDRGDALLEQARRAPAAYDFSGVVVIEWRDGTALRRAAVPVSDVAGVLEVGERHRMVGQGARRLVHGDAGWEVLWGDAAPEAPPAAGVKYDLVVRDGPEVAGRATAVVEASRSGSPGVRERLYVDDETGLLLRREQLDGRGRTLRAVGFESISDPIAADTETPPSLPRADQPAKRREPRSVETVHDPYRAPNDAGDQFTLVGQYRDADGTLQLFYSDGLFDVSVFEQAGALDANVLPDGGRWVELRGHHARLYESLMGEAVVWEGAGVVYTCVTDAPRRELEAMLADFPRRTSPSAMQSLVDAVLGPFSWS
jgi:hypothetical protein